MLKSLICSCCDSGEVCKISSNNWNLNYAIVAFSICRKAKIGAIVWNFGIVDDIADITTHAKFHVNWLSGFRVPAPLKSAILINYGYHWGVWAPTFRVTCLYRKRMSTMHLPLLRHWFRVLNCAKTIFLRWRTFAMAGRYHVVAYARKLRRGEYSPPRNRLNHIDIDIATFRQYRTDIVSKSKKSHRIITTSSPDNYLALSPLQTISRKRGLKFALSWTSRFACKRFRIPAV